jgi:hypothetical protein
MKYLAHEEKWQFFRVPSSEEMPCTDFERLGISLPHNRGKSIT